MKTIDIFEKNKCSYLRIFLMVYICIRHLGDYESSIPFFLKQGFLACGIFFLLSGYGLMLSYNKKGSEYLQGYFKKRVLRLIIPLILVFPVFLLIKYGLGDLSGFGLKNYLKDIRGSRFIINYSWYVYIQIYLYILFFFEVKKKNNQLRMLIFNIAVVLVMFLLKFSACYYLSTFCFNLGIYLANKEHLKVNILKTMLSLVGFIALMVPYISLENYYIKYPIGIFACLAFALFTTYALSYISVGANNALSKISSITYECYICQGIVFLLYYRILNIDINVVVNCLLCVCAIFILGFVVNMISNKIFKRFI
ncbi:acyltransferase family protein [Butyrivibrio sp. VCB2001]|uniref:acyltransferase family protein n=1 Tax=Butyrivibrio sp. VCB2001 TaxID=1280667 RepID=UPI00041507E5|nr:acyltransferase family protein [Butyrivibrio sp. VCB2001]